MEDLYVREVIPLGYKNIRLVRNDGAAVQGPKSMYAALEKDLMAIEPLGFELSDDFWKILSNAWGGLNE